MAGQRPAVPLPLQRGRHKSASMQSGPSTPTSSLRTTTMRSGSPHSRNSPASNPSREDGEAEGAMDQAAECFAVPEARTPKVLWASTPTPKANQSTYSFALPPKGQGPTTAAKLNAEAAAFIPDRTSLQPKEEISQALQACEPCEFHAEAQAVMMAESVLGLESAPKQRPVAQGTCKSSKAVDQDVAQDALASRDQGPAEPAHPTPGRLPSKGSAYHEQGQCRPCAWMWKPRGCQNADACEYCHLCPEGELKHRKKLKIAAIRMGALAALPSQDKGTARRGLKLSTLL